MEILHAIVLGIVQGLSEFLPISSSGHLELTRWLFGWDALDEDLETAFDVAVHLGTLVGAIAYLRRDVVMYVTAGFGPLRGRPLGTEGKIAWFLVASAVPAGIAGVVLKDQIADFDRIWMIAVMLIVFGLLLLVADRLPERKELEAFRLRDALAMGVGQALALQPGVSRSGATLTVSRFLGYERDAAARLVFLMSLPSSRARACSPWPMRRSRRTSGRPSYGAWPPPLSPAMSPCGERSSSCDRVPSLPSSSTASWWGSRSCCFSPRVGVDQPLSTGTTPACPDALTTSPTTSAGTATPRSASDAMTTSASVAISRPSTA